MVCVVVVYFFLLSDIWVVFSFVCSSVSRSAPLLRLQRSFASAAAPTPKPAEQKEEEEYDDEREVGVSQKDGQVTTTRQTNGWDAILCHTTLTPFLVSLLCSPSPGLVSPSCSSPVVVPSLICFGLRIRL